MSQRDRPSRFDPELVELLADEPELLAVADAIGATQQARRVRKWPALAVAATLAAAALAVVLVWPAGERGLVEEALAAVGTQRVVHSVVHRPSPDSVVIDLASGAERRPTILVETWFDSESGRARSIVRRGGQLITDDAVAASGTASRPIADEALRLTRAYRAALANGHVEVVERGTFESRQVVWLQLPRQQIAIDAQSYLPVAFRADDQRRATAAWAVRTLESVASLSALEPERGSDRGPTAGSVTATRTIDRGALSQALGGGAVWAGPKVAGLQLAAIRAHTLVRRYADGQSERSRGIELVYRRRSSQLVLREALAPEPAYGFVEGRLSFSFDPLPKAGELLVIEPERAGAWLGQLRTGEVWITIRAPTKALLMTTARSLRDL